MQMASFFFPFTLFFFFTYHKKERSLERLSALSSQMDLNRKKLMNNKLELTVAEAREWWSCFSKFQLLQTANVKCLRVQETQRGRPYNKLYPRFQILSFFPFLHFLKKRRKKKCKFDFFSFYVFLSLFFFKILSLSNSILLILGFVDNILDRHNSYSCKSNTTFFHYLICHIYPKSMYISIFKILKFIKIFTIWWSQVAQPRRLNSTFIIYNNMIYIYIYGKI